MIDPIYLSIVGPTAVGKTEFALQVADWILENDSRQFTGIDIISADSRQVYQGLSIISGSDVPVGFTSTSDSQLQYPFFCNGTQKIAIHGQEIISPSTEWSVYDFQQFATQVMRWSWQQGRLPIVLGGTGLYQTALGQPDLPNQAGPNEELRAEAAQKSVAELQEWLAEVDPTALAELNQSDRNNPRRLIRAIEKKLDQNHAQKNESSNPATTQAKTLTIGLTDSIDAIAERIAERVTQRIKAGALNELERLLAMVSESNQQKLPALSATGIKPLLAVLHDQIELEACSELWATQERQYAKRQLTWWKKYLAVKWFTITEADWQVQALELINTWLNPT